MLPAGIRAFEKRKESKSKIYSHENELVELPDTYLKQFQANKKAWEFFNSQAPSYRKTAFHVVMKSKQEAIQLKWLNQLIVDSENEQRLAQLSWNKKK